MRPDALRAALSALDGPTIVGAQAGEVNTGSFDPLREIVEIVREKGAWLHVDGAFGLWVAASPARRHLVDGGRRRGLVGHRRAQMAERPVRLRARALSAPGGPHASMTMKASYFEGQGRWVRDAVDWTPASSRRARASTVYAALRSLGRPGVAELVDRCCSHADRFAAAIAGLPGCELLNDVVLNQVLFRFADDEATNAVLAHVQASGEAWMGGTVWDSRGRDPRLRLELAHDRDRHRPHGRRLRAGARRGRTNPGAARYLERLTVPGTVKATRVRRSVHNASVAAKRRYRR